MIFIVTYKLIFDIYSYHKAEYITLETSLKIGYINEVEYVFFYCIYLISKANTIACNSRQSELYIYSFDRKVISYI